MKAKNKIAGIEVMEMPTPWIVGSVNVFLIFTEKLTLVDCGVKDQQAWNDFKLFLKKQGLTIKDIDQIVLTHHHSDHVGFLDWLLEEHPIPVYGHKNCRPYLTSDAEHIRNGTQFFEKFYLEFGIPFRQSEQMISAKVWNEGLSNKVYLSMDLEENSAIPGMPGWQVIETKGHAQSHISLYRPQDQVLICGDHIIKHAPAGIFMEPPIFPETERQKSLLQYMESIHKCLNIPVSIALSGHGEAIDNLADLLSETLRKIEKRAGRLEKQLTGKSQTGYEIIKDLYHDKYKNGLELFVSDTIALLDLLLERRKITAKRENGVIYYTSE